MTVTHQNGQQFIVDFATQSNVFTATQDCTIEFYCYKKPSYKMAEKSRSKQAGLNGKRGRTEE